MINKLFVYGTLLQGEIRNNLLTDWNLIDAFETEGTLYDTNFGYPAADFKDREKNKIYGELYLYDKNNLESTLNEIDLIEGVNTKLFDRVILKKGGVSFYSYNLSEELKRSLENFKIIHSGNWRTKGSLAKKNISQFAINFEESQSTRYKEFPIKGSKDFIFTPGTLPILITSSHATSHIRKEKVKAQEIYTGAISVILNSLIGTHSLYTIWASEFDSNYYSSTPLKDFVANIIRKYNIKLIIDLHGTGSYRIFDIYPGIGKNREFLNEQNFIIEELRMILQKNYIKLGGTNVFPAYRQHTVSRFANSELGIPAMQIEINQKYRKPESDEYLFEKLINTLVEYLKTVSKSI